MSERVDAAGPTSAERPIAERLGPVEAPTPPSHPDVVEWRPATADDIDAIHALILASDRVDHPNHVTPRDEIVEIFEASYHDPARDSLVGFAADGQAVALGYVMTHPSRDEHVHVYLGGRVDPAYRGRGIGREVLRWEHEHARHLLAGVDATVPAAVFVYVDETDAGARRIAERRGFAVERWFTTMVRDLALEIPAIEPIPAKEDAERDAGAPASPPLQVVAYTPDRKEATRVARNDSFRDHWGSLETPTERWDTFIEGPHFRRDLSWIAVEGDRVVAFAIGSVNEDDWVAQGYSSVYIDLIGVVRDRRGRRLAPAVITAQLRAARAAGLEKAVLDVDTESPTGANSLYGRLGFEPTERSAALVLHV